ncbi:MAG: hypothetical protein GF308_14550 [Candidatus Heimdallarchaeota archaeon]|nr:hypothetical protein [Candidatus Heimdallarchaeota archaeon]
MSKEENIFAECICKKDIKVKTVLVGFPGMGLTGSIASSHMSEQLEFETVGYIKGTAIPPVSVFLDGYLRYPYRIMGKEGKDIAIFIGESAVSPQGAYHMAQAITRWTEKHGASEIITLDGFGYMNKDDEGKVYMVAEPEIKKRAEKIDIPPLKSGYITGFAGAILNEAIISDLDGYALLVGTRPELPDPGGAAELVQAINKLKGFDIDVESLLEQAETIKKKLAELADQAKQMRQEGASPRGKPSTYYT